MQVYEEGTDEESLSEIKEISDDDNIDDELVDFCEVNESMTSQNKTTETIRNDGLIPGKCVSVKFLLRQVRAIELYLEVRCWRSS